MLPSTTWPARLAVVALLALLCTASLMLWQQLETAEQRHLHERVESQARELSRQLQNTLHYEVESLARIARLWNSFGRLPRASWETEVSQALQEFPGYQSIQWLGADLRMRWVLPVQGNEAAVNFRLPVEHPNYIVLQQAREQGRQLFSGSIMLAQGGRGFVLYTPLYIKDSRGMSQFDGSLQGVFRVNTLMDQLLTQIDSRGFSVELLEGSQPLYSREQPDSLPQDAVEVPLELLGNTHFTLRLSPSRALVEQQASALPRIVLGASLAISLLLCIALLLGLINSRRAQLLQLANQRLSFEARLRLQTEQALTRNREQLQLILDLTDSSHDSLLIFDTRTREVLHMNQIAHSSLGYPAERFAELLKNAPEQLMPGFDDWLEAVRQRPGESPSLVSERELISRDGQHLPVEISARLAMRGGREYLIGVSRDNSARRALEEHLQHQAQVDGLTGLYNRRFFDQKLLSEWRRLRRIDAPLTLLMLDIDHFKPFNDSLGHLAGDDALRQVGGALQRSLQREGDVACRYGGEEFAIILVNTGIEGGEHLAERVHALIAELNIAHPHSPHGRLSLSIGVASMRPALGGEPEILIARSDQALYRAKHAGRNRTCSEDAGAAV